MQLEIKQQLSHFAKPLLTAVFIRVWRNNNN